MWWKIILIVVVGFVVASFLTLAIGKQVFKRSVNSEAAKLLSRPDQIGSKSIITEQDLARLPEPVQMYLRYSGVVGKELTETVRLRQKGSLRQGWQPWMYFEAEQYYTTNPPAFTWIVDIKAYPLLSVKGRDMYYQGAGSMLIKIPPFTIGDARSKEMDQGTLVRYLNEIMWFPSAYLSDYIEWESIDSTSAMATITYGGVSASATLYFDDEGRMTNFEALRYHTEGDSYSLVTWNTPIKEYAQINGMRLPIKAEAVWKLESGDFSDITVELTDIEYNNRELY